VTVDNEALAALALAAAKKPTWNRPPQTTLGPKITSQSQEGQYHPRVEAVQALLSGLTQTARTSVLSTRLTWVGARKHAAESALQALNVPATLPSTLARTKVSNDEWPLTKADVRVRRLWFRLRAGLRESLNNEVFDTPEVFDTDRAFAALSDGTVVTAAAANASSSARLLLQMRCLADIYARWEVASRLAKEVVDTQLATPVLSGAEMLARILAYGRIEGDLGILPEDDTLEGTDTGSDSSHIPLPPGRSQFIPHLDPSAYMFCVTHLVQPKDFRPLNSKYPDLSDPKIRAAWADAGFTIALGGLDILWDTTMQKAAEEMVHDDPNGFVPKNLFDWPALNWQAGLGGAHPDPKAAAEAAYKARMALLTERMKGTSLQQASRTTALASGSYTGLYAGAGGPYSGAGANYVELVLGEGVRYLNRLTYGPTRFGPGAPAKLPEILVYLLYHTGHESKALLASAASHALLAKSTSSYARALRDALHNAGLTPDLQKKLDRVRHAKKKGKDVEVGIAIWPDISKILGVNTVINALADYLRNERDDDVWTTRVTQRANCIGYAQLYFYLKSEITGS